jgi:hypothetical protein
MSNVMDSPEDLRDEIQKKLSQASGICYVIRVCPDAATINESIRDSLWAVDELLEDAKKAVDELYQQLTSTGKGGSDAHRV